MTTAGRFGIYGGAFVPETLVPALEELEVAMNEALADPVFIAAKNAAFAMCLVVALSGRASTTTSS